MAEALSPVGRALLTVGCAAVTFANPARADTLALLGDLTSGIATPHLLRRISKSDEGREMLRTLTPTRFPERGSASLRQLHSLPDGSLGQQYAQFMQQRAFVPESRMKVRFVDDDRQRWVIQRYRDVHDLWHVLTGMPTTLLGETAQKYFEATQTGLPVALLSCVAGTIRVSADKRHTLMTELVPWAVRCATNANDLLCIRYEDYLHRDVEQLRRLWNIEPAPRRDAVIA